MPFFKKTPVYLDFAAATPVSSSARAAFVDALSLCGNPSAPHEAGRIAKEALEVARARIATLAGTRPSSVVFTSGATEANALTLGGSVRAALAQGKKGADMHLLYLPSAHASVIHTVESLALLGVAVEKLKLSDGHIDYGHLKTQIRPETFLVAIDLVCSETGIVYDAREVRRTLDAVRGHGSRIALFVDASQAPRVLSYELERLGADFLTLDAQKVGAVRGIGALVRGPHAPRIVPLMEGGGQEDGLRPGTENPALASAFAVALEECARTRDAFRERAARERATLVASIRSLPNVYVHEGTEQSPHILNVSFVGRDTDYLLALLSEEGFYVSTKSACESDAMSSRAVLALTGNEEQAATTLRVSWDKETTSRELADFAHALHRAVSFLDAQAL